MKKIKQIIILLIIFFIIVLVFNKITKIKRFGSPKGNNNPIVNNNTNTEPIDNPVDGSVIFGLNAVVGNTEEIQYSINVMDDLDLDRIRFFENWILRQPSLEKVNWRGLDKRINGPSDANKKIAITIKPVGTQNGELSWYCQEEGANLNSCVFKPEHEDDFAQYIESIIKRYPGKIDKIQFSNEWDSNYHFVGTAQDYVKYSNLVYDTVKLHSPETTVALGGITKWPLVYLAGCQLGLIDEFYTEEGELVSPSQKEAWCNSAEVIERNQRVKYVFINAKYDMVDIHLYDDPENWAAYVEALQSNLNLEDKPIILTEFGGPREQDPRFGDPYDEEVQATQLQKYIDKLKELPVSEAYYFRLIEGDGIGIGHPLTGLMKLIDGTPVKKPNYDVFKNR
ncbi:hypothetical protein HON36_00705 [Candidatus Parcubacteria bacterium]|jgi:hypothetical protein|nr:hypothetical protein [Candidatus Parcubacteria bacterium]